MNENLNWIGHTPQEIDLEFQLEWQVEEFTEWQFKEIQHS